MFVSIKLFSQAGNIGVNTSFPQATFDIRGKNDTGSSGVAVPGAVSANDGILVPRVNSLAINGSINGQLVYLVADAGTFARGFHYWNGTIWTPLLIPARADTTVDAWINNSSATPPRIELGTNADGTTTRAAFSEFVMTDVGNVGIGTTTPNSQLDVRTNFSNADIARIGSSTQRLAFGVSATNNGPYITTNNGTNASLRLGVNGLEHMRIDASAATLGNVGIGVGNAAVNNALQIHRTGVTDVFQQFTNGQVGILATDGLKIGVSSTGEASIQNLESSPLSFHTNAIERMTILPNGFVGVGNTNPSTRLHISGSDWPSSSITLNDSNTGLGQQVSFNGDTRIWNIGSANSGAGNLANKLFIYDQTDGKSRFIVNSIGNIGIGEDSPNHKLSINGGISVGNGSFGIDTAYSDDNNYITFKDANGSSSEDFIGYKDNTFYFRDCPGGADSSQPDVALYGNLQGYGNVNAWNKLGVGGNDFTQITDKGIAIFNDGSTAIAIRNGGDLDVYSPDNNHKARLRVENGSTNTLSIDSNGKVFNFNGTGGSVSSDIRLKQDIVKEENSLSKILQLNGYSYRFKKNANDPHKEYGVIAQEVIKVLPEAVFTDKDGYYSVSYSSLIPILINAIKEQQIQIDKLKGLLEKNN